MKHYTTFLLIIVLLALLAGRAAAEPMAPEPTTVDAFTDLIPGEPNDTFATANDAFEGYLMTPADVDYLVLNLSGPYRLRPFVDINSESYGVPVVLRVELALYDAGQSLLAEDADCDGTAALPDQFVPAGVYYLRVRVCAGAFDADQLYHLDAFTYSWPYEWEPNNSRATANPFDYGDTEAAIAPAGDVDFFRFQALAGEVGWLSLESYDDTLDLEAALLAADGAVLASSVPGYLDYEIPADGIYYFRVRSAAHPAGTGDYRIYGDHEFDDASPGDVEPNDTPVQAVPVAYGDRLSGNVDESDVIDYYRFTAQAGDKIALAVDIYYGGTDADVALYDPSMNPVVLNQDEYAGAIWTTLPVAGVYTLAFSYTVNDWSEYYDYILVLTAGDEPNNTMSTASEVPFGSVLDMTVDYRCDIDWLRFQGRAGDVVAELGEDVADPSTFLYDAGGDPVGPVLPADGTYYVKIYAFYDGREGSFCYEGEDGYPFVDTYPFGQALWVSAAVDGLGGNAAINRRDIATRKTAAGQWQIVFDASDVGITQNVAAFERMPNGSILMSLGGTQNVAGLGKVTPQDIIRFNPTALGDTTAGTFAWFLDGSDVGLSTSGEKIDAISMQRDVENPLRISIAGAGSVPRQSGGALKVADEDVINYVGTFGADPVGKWRVYLDGSTVPGMASEDVSGMTRVEVYPQRDSPTLLTFDSSFTISGQAGTTFDVLQMLHEGNWRTAVTRLTDRKIDGLSVGPAWTN